jgi:hypothetical protein
MSLKKTVSIVFVFVLLFAAISSVNAQESAFEILRWFYSYMPENCQDAIKRFPADLQSGFQGAYIVMTTFGENSDEEVLKILNSCLTLNYIKTNIILQGKGNEMLSDSETFSQYYTRARPAALAGLVALRMAMVMSGTLSDASAEIWINRLSDWL